MSKSKMLKVSEAAGGLVLALYIRVSTDRQADEGYSIDIQTEKLQAYAKTISGVDEVRLYTDDGYSGGSLDRPKMGKLIDDIQRGEITHVMVVKLDRLSRSLKDTMHLIEDVFIPNNVTFISILESFNTNTPFGRAMVGILSVFAQLERENIFERTRGGMQKRVEAGFWPGGGRTPYGYDYDLTQGILVPNADAEKVRYIYDRYLNGEALQAIADALGLKYERVAYNILTRKSNAGFIVYNGQEYRGKHEPIISLETYERAMELLRIRSANKMVCKTDHLLTGLVRCGRCGARMRYSKWGKAGYKLVCYSQQTSKRYLVKDPNCDNPATWAEDVEDGVVQALFLAAKERLVDARKTVESQGTSAMLQEQLERTEAKLRRLYSLYGDDGDEALLDTIQETKAEVARLGESLIDENTRNSAARNAMRTFAQLEGIQDAWDEMSVPEQRMVLASVVESITIDSEFTDVKLKYGLNTQLS
ncbi:recombinase family protein [Oscillibacter sp. GMB15532]|uniref:recombinase family protein n=1 Tax=Oscillibacter sp. GMB15532 TaxID=3230022 RepID=UPI0034DFD401